MTKQDWTEVLLFSGFRLMATGLRITGVLFLLFQLVESWHQFDPNYFGAFFLSTLFRPLFLFLAGVLLHFLAKPLSKYMARPFSRSS